MERDVAQPITGGCLCGAVRFEGEAFLQSAYYLPLHDLPEDVGQALRDWNSNQDWNAAFHKR
jgi:hypothetical protein